MESVCVTGATGFVAGHLIKLLLSEGYRVVGTVRDLHREEKLTPLKRLKNASENLELKQIADISKYEGFVEAFQGCKCVFHLAAPVFDKSPDIVQIAINGTLNACKAALEVGIKRIVLTASMASIGNSKDADSSHIWTEKDWNEDPDTPYSKEKSEAERVAWNFVKDLPGLELVTIHPSVVLGPALGKNLISSTILHHGLHLVDGTMKDQVKGGNSERFGIVSVHDIAEIHFHAMRAKDAKNQRYLVSNPEQWSHLRVAQTIKKHFSSLNVPESETERTELLDRFVDCSRAIDLLGHPLKKAEDAIVEMVQSFIDLGVVRQE